jgi:hypothetical protein
MFVMFVASPESVHTHTTRQQQTTTTMTRRRRCTATMRGNDNESQPRRWTSIVWAVGMFFLLHSLLFSSLTKCFITVFNDDDIQQRHTMYDNRQRRSMYNNDIQRRQQRGARAMMTRSSPDDASCIVWAVGTFSFTFITFLSLTKCFITVFSYDDDDIQQQQKCTTTTWHPSHNHLHHSKHGPTTMTTTTMTCRGVFRYVFNVFNVFYLLFLFIDSTNLKMTCTSRRECHGKPWGFPGKPAPVPVETRTRSTGAGFGGYGRGFYKTHGSHRSLAHIR